MNDKLSKVSKIDQSKIISNNYFQTYIEEAKRVGLLSKIEITNLQIMLVKLLETQIQRYTRFESSSVRVETAEGLMRSILYALDFKFKQLKGEIEEGVNLLKTQSLEAIFREGVDLLKWQVEKSKEYFQRVQANRLKVDNYAYNDTIDHAFTEFYPYYEPEFSAQSSACDIDYPLCIDDMKEEGIEYVYGYLKKLYYENEFCNHFESEEVQTLLNSLQLDQKELLINIFEMVLINALGRQLVGRDLTGLSLSKEDVHTLQIQFENTEDYQGLLQEGAEKLMRVFEVKGFLKHYILEALPPIVSSVQSAVLNKNLDKVFIPFKSSEDMKTIYFKDGVSLEDDAFKEMIEEVCNTPYITEKLEIFKARVHSLKDMIDFLEAECLYGKEYRSLYRTLSEVEIALLLNRLALEDEQSFQSRLQEMKMNRVSLRPWESELIYFLASKEVNMRQKLWLVVAHIQIHIV